MDLKQEILKYTPNKDEAIKILKDIGLSDDEINQLTDCKIPEEVIYDTAHRIIDRIASYSDDILDKFAKLLNAKNHRFSFKTEFFLKAAYFLKKKAYVQYIIEREGEKIQEISKMNIGVKSDIPEITKQLIDDIAKAIMYTNGDPQLVMKLITKREKQFKDMIKQRSTAICTPCSFNKSLESYKTVGDCVRGMLLYNELVGQEIFKPGSKGFKIYCKGIDYKKLGLSPDEYLNKLKNVAKIIGKVTGKEPDMKIMDKRIVIPDDFETIPDWIILDSDTIMQKIFVDRVNEMLEPFGISVDTGTPLGLQDIF